MRTIWRVLSGTACALALGLGSALASTAHPGMLNYVEGRVLVSGRTVGSSAVGSADVGPGQVLETTDGKAEVLLTPGVFLRVGDNSRVAIGRAGLTDTRVELLRGKALVEAADLQRENNIQVLNDGSRTRLQKNGLYKFDADRGRIAVYNGKAEVWEGDNRVEVKKGKELQLSGPLKAEKFDRKETDSLYEWSSLRSRYLAEASAVTARTYVVNPAGWAGSGWYWNPWYHSYAFLPGDGFFASPFGGWGYYSPYAYAPYAYAYRPVVVVPRYRVIRPANPINLGRSAGPPIGAIPMGTRSGAIRSGRLH